MATSAAHSYAHSSVSDVYFVLSDSVSESRALPSAVSAWNLLHFFFMLTNRAMHALNGNISFEEEFKNTNHSSSVDSTRIKGRASAFIASSHLLSPTLRSRLLNELASRPVPTHDAIETFWRTHRLVPFKGSLQLGLSSSHYDMLVKKRLYLSRIVIARVRAHDLADHVGLPFEYLFAQLTRKERNRRQHASNGNPHVHFTYLWTIPLCPRPTLRERFISFVETWFPIVALAIVGYCVWQRLKADHHNKFMHSINGNMRTFAEVVIEELMHISANPDSNYRLIFDDDEVMANYPSRVRSLLMPGLITSNNATPVDIPRGTNLAARVIYPNFLHLHLELELHYDLLARDSLLDLLETNFVYCNVHIIDRKSVV